MGAAGSVICTELGEPFACTSARRCTLPAAFFGPRRTRQRALELARSEGATRCASSPICAARHQRDRSVAQRNAPQEIAQTCKSESADRSSAVERMLRRLVTFEPELYELAKEARASSATAISRKLVRDSVWKEIR
jgi:hypothetical protein